MEPPGIPPLNKRCPPQPLISLSRASIADNPSQSHSVLDSSMNSTFNGSLTSAPPNRSQNRMIKGVKTSEASLHAVLKNFSHPSLPEPIFPAIDCEDAETNIRLVLQRISPLTCLTVIQTMYDNVSASLKIQKDYLEALESLLEDVCEPEETIGLSDRYIRDIYETLIKVSRLEWEMRLRLTVLDGLTTLLEGMEELKEDALMDAKSRDAVAGENIGEMFRVKFAELVGDGSKAAKLPRIKRWRRLVSNRGLKAWTDEENGYSGEEVLDSSEETDDLADVSTNSAGDTKESAPPI